MLADFGHATSEPAYPCGTPDYHTPNILHPDKYGALTTRSDFYSFGLSMHELRVGYCEARWRIGQDPGKLVLPPQLRGLAIQQLLEACLAANPQDRIEMTEGQGLHYFEIFRNIREEKAALWKVLTEVWFDPLKRDSGSEMSLVSSRSDEDEVMEDAEERLSGVEDGDFEDEEGSKEEDFEEEDDFEEDDDEMDEVYTKMAPSVMSLCKRPVTLLSNVTFNDMVTRTC